MELQQAAIHYAMLHGRWFLADKGTRVEIDRTTSIAHDRFIDACKALSRTCGAAGLSLDWRAEWGPAQSGEARKRIGDFACYIAYRCTLKAR